MNIRSQAAHADNSSIQPKAMDDVNHLLTLSQITILWLSF